MKKERTLLKSISSVLFALFASAHHWLHTLLIALGLTSLGAGLFSMAPSLKLIFLVISLLLSIWFIVVAKRRWKKDRPAAWVYFISSIISIILVITAVPQSISDFLDKPVQQNNQQEEHSEHHK
ncbi:hypothetical protein CA600_28500 [Paenibacillus sp. VTT E-133280]|uniref:hypothetical protein n=1 Tax=unclassified Paenibacillus TaxID=185978 RepID=UPI000BA1459B|nr:MULTISPECIES: hypothetical protein [unclassified Paenibacillus]MBY3621392.1 hypothetical protein [Acinetobacter sp. CUI P1]MDH6372997.1 heme O synthase-like polyprenyltransferase [Paenibacillus sp. PastF-3]OZQ60334.1 hypothetical protein CA600_28500 [Paenibacillus sp. VTT E-133280]